MDKVEKLAEFATKPEFFIGWLPDLLMDVRPSDEYLGHNTMYWFIQKLYTEMKSPQYNPKRWAQLMPVVVDMLASRGFRCNGFDDIKGPFVFMKSCIERIDFINYIEGIGLWLPPDVVELRKDMMERVRPALSHLSPLRRLPAIPKTDLRRSEKTYAHFNGTTGFDIHNEGLNILRGTPVSGHIPASTLIMLRRMENFFQQNSSLTKTAFVFRGMRLSSLNDLNMDPDTVTFVTWDLEKALQYFFTPASFEDQSNDTPILLVIRLEPGTPVIRTRFPEELVLPTGSYFEPEAEPIMLQDIFCYKENLGQAGAIVHVRCLPTKRGRVGPLYAKKGSS